MIACQQIYSVEFGPSIGPCCYEVGEEVIQTVASLPFNTKGYLRESGTAGKAVFDLWAANKIQFDRSRTEGRTYRDFLSVHTM